jgi:hypothetical protein
LRYAIKNIFSIFSRKKLKKFGAKKKKFTFVQKISQKKGCCEGLMWALISVKTATFGFTLYILFLSRPLQIHL